MATMAQTSIAQILREELLGLQQRIAANIINTGRQATGKTIRSMKVQVSQLSGVLTGRQAFSTLERGSRPWVKQYNRPPRWFAEQIQQWIDAKRLDLSAYAVASNLMRKGSDLYRAGGGATDVYTEELPKTLRNIGARLADRYSYLVTGRLNTNSKEIIEI